MIAIDTSLLMAITLGEAQADACIGVLETEPELVISAGIVAEGVIVIRQAAMQRLFST